MSNERAGSRTETDRVPADARAPVIAGPNRDSPADEVAWAIAAIVPELPQETAADLQRLLRHSITAPRPSELREARLGLLIDLVSDGSGEVPSSDDYNRVRGEREEIGQTWPAHTTLIRAYGGHWLAAVRAAMRVAYSDTAINVAASPGYFGSRLAYSRDEVAAAIASCWRNLGLDPDGPGPTQEEYLEWAGLTRRARRLAGKPDPRLPGSSAVRRLCGNWGRAVALATSQSG